MQTFPGVVLVIEIDTFLMSCSIYREIEKAPLLCHEKGETLLTAKQQEQKEFNRCWLMAKAIFHGQQTPESREDYRLVKRETRRNLFKNNKKSATERQKTV